MDWIPVGPVLLSRLGGELKRRDAVFTELVQSRDSVVATAALLTVGFGGVFYEKIEYVLIYPARSVEWRELDEMIREHCEAQGFEPYRALLSSKRFSRVTEEGREIITAVVTNGFTLYGQPEVIVSIELELETL